MEEFHIVHIHKALEPFAVAITPARHSDTEFENYRKIK
jgi:hypothetical protein